MKMKAFLFPILAASLVLWPFPARAVDDTAANLIPEGKISLSQIIDTLNKRYPKDKELFWNVSGIAFHNFTGVPQSDVIVGLAGYRDRGMIYNGGKQLVEDAGAGFAYFHLVKEEWKLAQVEVVEGKKYIGFEGADLTGAGKDQLVVYSSTGDEQMATVFAIGGKGTFAKVSTILGYGLGPRVAQEAGKPLIVDFQRALVDRCDDCGIYYGRSYDWNGRGFIEQKNEFLDRVRSYNPLNSTDADTAQTLAFFEGYLSDHPGDFCALANCYDLSTRLGFKDKADQYRKKLLSAGDHSIDCKYCDDWMLNKNQASQKEYLNQLTGRKARKASDN